jgi:hypothetical protein
VDENIHLLAHLLKLLAHAGLVARAHVRPSGAVVVSTDEDTLAACRAGKFSFLADPATFEQTYPALPAASRRVVQLIEALVPTLIRRRAALQVGVGWSWWGRGRGGVGVGSGVGWCGALFA